MNSKTMAVVLALLAAPAQAQIQYPIPLQEIADKAVLGCFGGLDCIKSINYPGFETASAGVPLADSDLVLGILLRGQARAYPLRSLWFHEIVNDNIGPTHFALAYCPLTRTAIAFDASEPDGVIEYGVSGFLFNNNLIMYDRTNTPNHTFFPQMYFTGISGPRKDEILRLIPVTMMTWGAWKTLIPSTEVIERAWYEGAVYPYGSYRDEDDNFIFTQWVDERRRAKEMVYGVTSRDFRGKAYPFAELGTHAAINDVFRGDSILVVYNAAGRLATGFFRNAVAGRGALDFTLLATPTLERFMTDAQTGSVWNILGYAVEGELVGTSLIQLTRSYSGFWFAWAAYFETIEIYSGTATAVAGDEDAPVPEQLELAQNYPNPFNPGTRIRFYLPRTSEVRLMVYSLRGEDVATLIEGGERRAGWHRIEWRPKSLPSGTYIYRLTAGATVISRKMIYLR